VKEEREATHRKKDFYLSEQRDERHGLQEGGHARGKSRGGRASERNGGARSVFMKHRIGENRDRSNNLYSVKDMAAQQRRE